MNCNAVQIRLSAFLDGELVGSEMLAIRQHLGHCPVCAEESESLRTLKSLLGAGPEPEPSSEFETRLVSHVFALDAPAKRRGRGTLSAAVAATLAVALLAAIVLSGATLNAEGVSLESKRAAPEEIELKSDQAFSAGYDPLRSSPPMIPTSYGHR